VEIAGIGRDPCGRWKPPDPIGARKPKTNYCRRAERRLPFLQAVARMDGYGFDHRSQADGSSACEQANHHDAPADRPPREVDESDRGKNQEQCGRVWTWERTRICPFGTARGRTMTWPCRGCSPTRDYGQSCGQLHRFSPRPQILSPQVVHTTTLEPGGLVHAVVSW
jgi:hypothetical protein